MKQGKLKSTGQVVYALPYIGKGLDLIEYRRKLPGAVSGRTKGVRPTEVKERRHGYVQVLIGHQVANVRNSSIDWSA